LINVQRGHQIAMSFIESKPDLDHYCSLPAT
jgi:hypothetical protein